MKQLAHYLERQPDVVYKRVNEHRADVIVNSFISEENTEIDGVSQALQLSYWVNIFSVDPEEITESDIKSRVQYYLDYDPSEPSVDEKLRKLEEENMFLAQCLMEMSEIVYA